MGSIPNNPELKSWLKNHKGNNPMILRNWIRSAEQWCGWTLEFVQMFIYTDIKQSSGTLKTNLRSATHEVARRGEVLGDWAIVRNTAQLLETTIIFTDGTVGRVILEKKEITMSENRKQLKAHAGYVPDKGYGIVVDGKGWVCKGSNAKEVIYGKRISADVYLTVPAAEDAARELGFTVPTSD